MNIYIKHKRMNCPSCSVTLKEPFIKCMECNPDTYLCLNCFARGAEFDQHSNDHPYEIKVPLHYIHGQVWKSESYLTSAHTAFPLFVSENNRTSGEENWTARDEVHLLNEMADKGYGNWQEICKQFSNKKSKDVEEHYLEHYVNTSASTRLKQSKIKTKPFFRRPIAFTGSSVPPRPDGTDIEDDTLYLIGYMPARGDFVLEHDNFAECDLKDVEFDRNKNLNNLVVEQDHLAREMNLAMVDMYYTRLQERRARKRLIKRHGLIDICSSTSALVTHGREERFLRDTFCKFSQLTQAEEHEKLVQSILYQKLLEKKIARLQEYRRLGLKCLRDATTYEKFKSKRDRMKKPHMTKLDEVLLHVENPSSCQVWLQRQFTSKKSVILPQMPQGARKPSLPLDITGLPRSDILTEDEKKQESFQSNGVKLQTARTLLKIDVNKTKKLYDFLIQKGLIKT